MFTWGWEMTPTKETKDNFVLEALRLLTATPCSCQGGQNEGSCREQNYALCAQVPGGWDCVSLLCSSEGEWILRMCLSNKWMT